MFVISLIIPSAFVSAIIFNPCIRFAKEYVKIGVNLLNQKDNQAIGDAVAEYKSMQLVFNFQIIVNSLIVMVWLKPVHLGLENPYISLSEMRYGLVMVFTCLKIYSFKKELNNFTNRGYEYLKRLAIESTDGYY